MRGNFLRAFNQAQLTKIRAIGFDTQIEQTFSNNVVLGHWCIRKGRKRVDIGEQLRDENNLKNWIIQ